MSTAEPPAFKVPKSAAQSPWPWNSGSAWTSRSSGVQRHANRNDSALASRLACVRTAPFGAPVVPEVKPMRAGDPGSQASIAVVAWLLAPDDCAPQSRVEHRQPGRHLREHGRHAQGRRRSQPMGGPRLRHGAARARSAAGPKEREPILRAGSPGSRRPNQGTCPRSKGPWPVRRGRDPRAPTRRHGICSSSSPAVTHLRLSSGSPLPDATRSVAASGSDAQRAAQTRGSDPAGGHVDGGVARLVRKVSSPSERAHG